MRTTRSEVTFLHPFTLNKDFEELPAGHYEIETDEEEILTPERSAYCRTAIYFYVECAGSTRMLVINPADLESALRRDSASRAGLSGAETSR
jgi:hypothetical protein